MFLFCRSICYKGKRTERHSPRYVYNYHCRCFSSCLLLVYEQGIVPAKAAKMAHKSVTLMTEKLINIKVSLQRTKIIQENISVCCGCTFCLIRSNHGGNTPLTGPACGLWFSVFFHTEENTQPPIGLRSYKQRTCELLFQSERSIVFTFKTFRSLLST